MINSKTVVFVHGLFQNPKSWAGWVDYFTAKGYICHAPAYPYHEGEPEERRRNIDPRLGKLTFGQVMDSLAAYLDKLSEKPILIGHSMGGLAVQKLISMDKGAAAVAINSAPPKGMLSLKWNFLKANSPIVNPLKGDTPCMPSVNWFQYAFCNTMSMQRTKKEFDQYVVPESRNVPRTSRGEDGQIDFKKPHVPLLLIAGEKDNIIPPSLNRKNYNAYKDKNSHRSFKEFMGRTHYICGQENWQEVAAYIEEWIGRVGK